MAVKFPVIALVDAGPLIALFDPADKLHATVEDFFRGFVGRLHTTWPVVTEVCHFLSVPQQRACIAWLRRGGAQLADIEAAALDTLDTLIGKYADRPMDLADASLVWLGAKLKISDIVTIDRDDFSVYRAANGKPFRNLFPPV
ncbi:MAG: hypothetical protein Q8O25_03620 [Sulfurisoma sp.]|nr:hypothetical protein [Sulfurisoma sp.]